MTDEERPSRPNAKYKLSKGDGPVNPKEADLVFYYSREHRLAKAPQSVINLYNDAQKKSRFSLIRPLVADKPRLMLFIAIIVICVGIIVLSILGYFDGPYTIDGNKIEVKGTLFDGTTIVDLGKKAKNGEAYSGAVDITVSAAQSDEELPLFYHRVFFTLTPEEEYLFVVPFDSPELSMMIQTEKSYIIIKFKPEKRKFID